MTSNSGTVKTRFLGAAIATVGFVLSPLTWWNDLFVNIPLAYVIAIPFGLVSRDLFSGAMVLAYWLTNIVGLMMMHSGVVSAVSGKKTRYGKKELAKDLLVSCAYTLLIILLVKFNVLRLPTEYFG